MKAPQNWHYLHTAHLLKRVIISLGQKFCKVGNRLCSHVLFGIGIQAKPLQEGICREAQFPEWLTPDRLVSSRAPKELATTGSMCFCIVWRFM